MVLVLLTAGAVIHLPVAAELAVTAIKKPTRPAALELFPKVAMSLRRTEDMAVAVAVPEGMAVRATAMADQAAMVLAP